MPNSDDELESAASRRLVVISNRVPVGESRAGGLAVALTDALVTRESLWLGWSGEISDDQTPRAVSDTPAGEALVIDFTQDQFDGYYSGYSNRALWPALHYRLDLSDFRDRDYRAYVQVNELFAQNIMKVLRPSDVIWIHDYHLMLVAAELRRLGARNPIGFFSHIPFPAPEIFQAIPQHVELMRGLMSCDLVGLQSDQDRANFQRSLVELADGVRRPNGGVAAFGRHSVAKAIPIGIDAAAFAETAQLGEMRELGLVNATEREALILGVDRMDYSKGIPQRLEAIGELFRNHPELQEWATFVQVAPPSRSALEAYADLRREIDEKVGHLNGAYGTVNWTPIRYLATNIDREDIAALYRRARVGLVTPLRDGMNLVAKEYLAAQDPDDPGVLVLSSFAGASEQLKDAIIVNPHDTSGVARAIHSALMMPLGERRQRHARLMQVLLDHDARWWTDAFLRELASAHVANAADALRAQVPASGESQAAAPSDGRLRLPMG